MLFNNFFLNICVVSVFIFFTGTAVSILSFFNASLKIIIIIMVIINYSTAAFHRSLLRRLWKQTSPLLDCFATFHYPKFFMRIDKKYLAIDWNEGYTSMWFICNSLSCSRC